MQKGKAEVLFKKCFWKTETGNCGILILDGITPPIICLFKNMRNCPVYRERMKRKEVDKNESR